MMEEIKKIARKKIIEVILSSKEKGLKISDKDSILRNFELGRAFGKNSLQVDINGLNKYELLDYFPKGDDKDTWMFEFRTSYGEAMLIEIIHIVNELEQSYWKLIFSVARKEAPETPEIIFDTKYIIGYEEFIDTINGKYGNKINTEKY